MALLCSILYGEDCLFIGSHQHCLSGFYNSLGVYANVAPKPPARSRSFTLNTSPVPHHPSPTFFRSSHKGVGPPFSSPPHEGKSPELEDNNVYTAMNSNTMETREWMVRVHSEVAIHPHEKLHIPQHDSRFTLFRGVNMRGL